MMGGEKNNIQIVTIDGNTEYKVSEDHVELVTSKYPVFSGIDLVYNEVHAQECKELFNNNEYGEHVFEINHCREGRLECNSGDAFFYLTSGDLSIHKKKGKEHHFYFPSCNYSGISILIDVDKAPRCLSCFLNDVNVQPALIMNKFCGDDNHFVARSNIQLEHIFSELYQIPEEIRKGYLKIKIMEILLFLSCFKPEKAAEKKRYSSTQVVLAKRICDYLLSHMEERITIDKLTEVFHASSTQIKNSFKGVYGESVYSYIRSRKMENAAYELKTTDLSILEIANRHGYDNGSKFAAAFRDTMGMSPKEYRQNLM